MEKILFLDIDGVLNCQQTFIDNRTEKLKWVSMAMDCNRAFVKSAMCDIDIEKLELVKKITDLTGGKIVVCSSWIGMENYSLIEEELIKMGLPIVGRIDIGGDSIRNYISNHQVKRFVILNDSIFADYNELIDYLVQISYYRDGLNEELAKKAINILELKGPEAN